MSERETKPFRLGRGLPVQHWQVVAGLLMLWDALAVNAAYFLALWLRFDGMFTRIPSLYLNPFLRFAPIYTVLCIIVFYFCRMYNSIWRFASYAELKSVMLGTVITTVAHVAGITLVYRGTGAAGRMPLTYLIVGPILQFILTLGVRFMYRFVLLLRGKSLRRSPNLRRVMVIGAGQAGQTLLREINHTRKNAEEAVCVIDDNRNKWHRMMDGIPVVGGREKILEAAEKYRVDKIYFAIPTATAEERRDILAIASETGCELRQLPGIYQLASGEVTVSRTRKVSVEDLLGRDPIQTDMREVFEFIHGLRVLVTGGGGSIGSELCRQIAAHAPEQLVILDIYENNAYAIQLELKRKFPDLNLVTLIGSVRDSRKLWDVFETYRPQIVYHAAAHKHVPLMEDSPCEAIKNNPIGTYKTAWAAMAHGCERFVLISTDKAVNPTNIMGASKRLCEMIIQSFDALAREGRAAEIPPLRAHEEEAWLAPEALKDGKTRFVAVRFGNVLGSNGSVIPIFRKQIEAGGPVTVTHPDIIRYFMTIPEAVSLVMLAGTYARGGEIFVLDMGSPVKIADLARNLIRLSGYKPDVDIRIEYTGLRPGEKLYEEKLMAEEGLRRTENDLIHIGQPVAFDPDRFLSQIPALLSDACANDPDIRTRVQQLVTTYHPAESEN